MDSVCQGNHYMKKYGFVTFCLISMTAGLVTSDFAVAQNITPENAKNSPLYFANVDKNGDGSIGRSEVPKELSGLRANFAQYDLDHDHRLSEHEYVTYLKTMGQGACRENAHTESKCSSSPYSMSTPTMGVSDVNAPPGRPQRGN